MFFILLVMYNIRFVGVMILYDLSCLKRFIYENVLVYILWNLLLLNVVWKCYLLNKNFGVF